MSAFTSSVTGHCVITPTQMLTLIARQHLRKPKAEAVAANHDLVNALINLQTQNVKCQIRLSEQKSTSRAELLVRAHMPDCSGHLSHA